MKTTKLTTLLSFFVLFLSFSCGSDDGDPQLEGTNLSISDIQGNWEATRALFDIAGTGASQAIDIVAVGGSVTLNIQSNGRFTLTILAPGQPPETSTGQMSFDEDLLVVAFDGDANDPEFFGIQSTATTLSLSGNTEYDLDGDGVDDPATVELDLVRA